MTSLAFFRPASFDRGPTPAPPGQERRGSASWVNLFADRSQIVQLEAVWGTKSLWGRVRSDKP